MKPEPGVDHLGIARDATVDRLDAAVTADHRSVFECAIGQDHPAAENGYDQKPSSLLSVSPKRSSLTPMQSIMCRYMLQARRLSLPLSR